MPVSSLGNVLRAKKFALACPAFAGAAPAYAKLALRRA
jgi:hypothetical protein